MYLRKLALLLLALSCIAFASDTSPVQVRGTVTDSTGAALPGASVHFDSPQTHLTTATQNDGRFSLLVPPEPGTLTVSAPGFAQVTQPYASSNAPASLDVVLRPQTLDQKVTVTAGRRELRVSDTVPMVSLLESADVQRSGAVTLDDMLRQLPTFDLFRRSSSLVANPTSQGVSLRGLGASGASRALVMRDGIPLNDPFGGWVYWDRVPRTAIERLEVVHGGASDLYGSTALGGALNVLSRPAHETSLDLTGSYGELQTGEGSGSATAKLGKWGFAAAGESFNTGGYTLVPTDQRGRVDIPANSRHREGELLADYAFSQNSHAFVRGDAFGERRSNGKIGEGNDTGIRELATGYDLQSQSYGDLSFRAYGSSQRYDQSFFAVASDRSKDFLTRLQRVPAQQVGGSVQWSHTLGARNSLLAGFDYRDVKGFSREQLFNQNTGAETSISISGGRQRSEGIFFAHRFQVTPRLLITDGLRADFWTNGDASNATLSPANAPLSFTPLAEKHETALDPSLGLMYRAASHISFTASAYRAFRAPSLNELYRSFRLGNVLTTANNQLSAEHLTGAEGGALITGFNDKLALRATYFFADMTNPVGNITLSTTPALITRQRQNIGRIHSNGVEFEAEWQPVRRLFFSAGYQFADSKVVAFSANPTLIGNDVPEVPRNRVGFSARFDDPRYFTLALEGRASSRQFDDDQNQFPLDRYATLDLYFARRLAPGLEAFAAVENITNTRYLVTATPPVNLGTPRIARAGLRLHLGGR